MASPRFLLGLPLALLLAAASCVTDSRQCVRTETRCTDVYHTWSDPYYGVWTEVRTYCEPVCIERAPNRPVSCLGNPVCAPDHPCHDPRVCPAEPPAPPAGAGLCQDCDTSADCYEDHALCLQLDDDPTALGSCGRPCEFDEDCPGGFFCAELEGMDERQCTPLSYSCASTGR